jgi:thioredoxin-like negative regulator of GroEL
VKRAAQLVQQNKRHEAAALVKQLAQQYPEDADVWYLVGLLQTDPFKQREAYQKALQINPNHRLARTALQKLGI